MSKSRIVEVESKADPVIETELSPELQDAMADALNAVETRERSSQIETIVMDEDPDDEMLVADDEANIEDLGNGDVLTSEAPDQVENLEEIDPLALLQAENEELKEGRLRMAADFENFRKRKHRELDEARQFGITKLLEDLLPVLDNMQRALDHAPEVSDPVIDGIKMVARQFSETLKRHGVTTFQSMGELFNPELHEAMTQAPSADHPANTVIFEMERGYMIGDRLLRPTKVVVSTQVIDIDHEQGENGSNDTDDDIETEIENENQEQSES